MDRTELAWAAGFWDGEGWANLVRFGRGEVLRPMGRINQADVVGIPVALTRFRDATGLGRVSGPHIEERREPIYRWVISSRRDVERLGNLLGPWLGEVKRAQIEQASGTHIGSISWTELTVDERCAWAAGLWDGEGSICLLKHRSHAGHFVPEAALTQSSNDGVPEVLLRIASIGPPGFLYGPFPQEPPWSPVYRWKLFRMDEIRGLMDHLWPWLGPVKTEQAERIFSVLAEKPKLARGNPAWGSHKTHCVRGHEYATARIRPFRGRGKNTEPPRASHQCLVCVREDARAKRSARTKMNGGRRRRSRQPEA